MIFQNLDIVCKENKKSFLWFSWFGRHDLAVTAVESWGFEKYRVYWQCETCGAIITRFGLTHSELLHAGIDPSDAYTSLKKKQDETSKKSPMERATVKRSISCTCDGWQESFDQIVDSQVFLYVTKSIEYTGRTFVYCPWCGSMVGKEQ